MKNSFHNFLSDIVNQIDGTDEEKADLYEELQVHIHLAWEQYIDEGFTEEEAGQLAIKDFGSSKAIGNEMQKAMFPHRKTLLLITSIFSILYSFIAYSLVLMS